jgi:arginyl-tRNA synthetase
MQNLITQLEEMFSLSIQKAFHLPLFKAEITQSTQGSFGHYQCNSALKLSKELKLPSREVAAKMIENLQNKERFQSIEIAGPGFINLWISTKHLENELSLMLKEKKLGIELPHPPKKIIVEFSSPNVAKELHVGHLRSTIIGESIARLFEYLGHDVLRLNHIGDWGTQFGMLIAYIKRFHADVFESDAPIKIETLMEWYRDSKKLFDADEEFKKNAQLDVVSLQSGEKNAIKAWKRICEISRMAYEEIYALLDVKIIERGESFYNPYLKDVVANFVHQGIATESDGATCVFLEGFETAEKKPLPLIIQKSDGGYNYATTDLAALKHRIEHEKAERIIYVVDAGQKLHFDMVFKAAEKAGVLHFGKTAVEHVGFGVVLGEDGKKFKTRSGETVKLMDLLMEAVRRAKLIMQERLENASEVELHDLSIALGINALRYADLSSHRMKDYQFSYDRMLKFEGNTAAFLLYSYVRILSIQKKASIGVSELLNNIAIYLEHPSEIALAVHLRQFGECLVEYEQQLLPNRLCDYLFGLAEKFNNFFRDCKVVGDEKEASRLLICHVTQKVFEAGFSILGIKLMHRM